MIRTRHIPAWFVVLALTVLALVVLTAEAQASPAWLEDTLVAPGYTSIDHVVLDVSDDYTWYALASADGFHGKTGWFRSTDRGLTWSAFYDGTWGGFGGPIGGAYGFGVVLQLWQPYSETWCRVIDPADGTILHEYAMYDWDPCEAGEIVVASNSKSSATGVFVMVASEIEPTSGQATLRTSRSTNYGVSWWDTMSPDAGPWGEPDCFGDLDLQAAYGVPSRFHMVYDKEGRLWHARTTDSGHTWGSPVDLNVGLLPGSSVSVAFDGNSGYAVGESPDHDIVAVYSSNGGSTWSAPAVVDPAESGARIARNPAFCTGEKPPCLVYRKGDGRLGMRTHSLAYPGTWGDEIYISWGTTGTEFSAAMSGVSGGNVGVLYARTDDSGRPYFVCRQVEPSGVEEPLGPRADGVLLAMPNPSSGPVTLLLDRQAAGRRPTGVMEGFITDATGRSIAAFRVPSTSDRWVWDGKDASGRIVPQGLYYAHVPARAGSEAARIVIVR